MYFKTKRQYAPRYIHPSQEKQEKRRRFPALPFLLLMTAVLLFLALVGAFLKDISSQIAVSDACDIVTAQINRVISETMQEPNYVQGLRKFRLMEFP